jgi:(S)-sulfolactate dehydrogenase
VRVVIAEFMDDAAVAALRAQFQVTFDPGLVERRAELAGALRSLAG